MFGFFLLVMFFLWFCRLKEIEEDLNACEYKKINSGNSKNLFLFVIN